MEGKLSKAKSSIVSFAAKHTSVDIIIALLITMIWCGFVHIPNASKCQNGDLYKEIFSSLSTVSGILVAAATFLCTMVYQSDSRYMRYAIRNYSDELSRNWSSIIVWAMLTAILPIISLYIYQFHEKAAIAISLYSIVMIIAKTVRSVHWLKYTLFMDQASSRLQEGFTDEDMKKS